MSEKKKLQAGDGYRLLNIGEDIFETDEYLNARGVWTFAFKPSVGMKVQKHNYPYRRRIEPVDNTGVQIHTGGPYVAVEVYREALAEIDRLKDSVVKCVAEIEELQKRLWKYDPPAPKSEPEWFDLTPFDGHVLRAGVDQADLRSGFETVFNGGRLYVRDVKEVFGTAQFRCLLKDAPPEYLKPAGSPEVCAMCGKQGTDGCKDCTKYAIESTGCPVESEWPKYYTANPPYDSVIAYIIRDSQNEYRMMNCHGTISPNMHRWLPFDDQVRTQITKEQADAILAEKRPKPAEDPDEWVTQDRVPARPGVDERRWKNRYDVPDDWGSCSGLSQDAYHGLITGSGHRLELRCRRRDLPRKPETPSTVEVYHRYVTPFGQEFWVRDTGETREVKR